MKKEMNGKTIAIVALVVAIVGLSVGFASLSSVLNISGTGRVQSSSWDIHFANLQDADKSTGTREITPPTASGTDLRTYDVTFSQPGDYISYTFDIVNGGSYDAKISEVNLPTPTCEGTGATATTDAANVCKYLSYTLTYNDQAKTPLAVNDTLTVEDTKKTAVLTLRYNEVANANELPAATVTIGNLGISVKYVQQ